MKKTRKLLAKEIYKKNIILGLYDPNTCISEKAFVHACLYGCGAVKPIKLPELESWNNNLENRINEY